MHNIGEYPEYHTSLDNLTDVVTPEGLQGGFDALQEALLILENNYKPLVNVLCEPQLGKRGLYPTLSAKGSADKAVRDMMNIISFCDGEHDVLSISEKTSIPFEEVLTMLKDLELQELISFKQILH